jgi:hypothetical protein
MVVPVIINTGQFYNNILFYLINKHKYSKKNAGQAAIEMLKKIKIRYKNCYGYDKKRQEAGVGAESISALISNGADMDMNRADMESNRADMESAPTVLTDMDGNGGGYGIRPYFFETGDGRQETNLHSISIQGVLQVV